MSKEVREVIADWLIVLGAVALFVSLFLTWSHQFSPAFLAVFGASAALHGVPRDPTAWQLYSAADIVFAALAGALLVVALIGGRAARIGCLVATAVGLGFTVHALSHPPTNGGTIFDPALGVPDYVPTGATAGAGETVAIVALVIALAGLALSFTAD